MKVLHNETNNRTYFNPVITLIERAARSVTSQYNFSVPRGWQLIVKMKSGDETFFHLHLAEGEGGSYAVAKMATLENFPDIPYTGDDGNNDLIDMLEHLGYNDAEIITEVAELESLSQLTKAQKEWLRDTCKLACMYGGIRIPYESLINTDEGFHDARGEILIAFSGASQEQDVFFCIWILYALQQALLKHQDNIQHTYILEDVKLNPIIHHWLTAMDISDHD